MSPLWKQVRSPVWQAGPAGSTCASRASASQSQRSPRTRWMLPDVAPLCQSSCRERLQNHISPLSRVRRSASRSMYATVSTSPVRQSCTTQGSGPLSQASCSSGIESIAVIMECGAQ